MEKQKMRQIGVVGLGLMGTSIIVSFLNAGYRIIAMTPLVEELEIGGQRINDHLQLCESMGFLNYDLSHYQQAMQITSSYEDLKDCDLVVECVIEIEDIKAQVYHQIERVVNHNAIIATNTSAIPISQLQQYLTHPSRFMGIHWAEPAYATRFLEITCGKHTDHELAKKVKTEAEYWEKEPTLLYKDIRGFITNRLMYAIYREGFHLMNKQIASMSALDKCFQYDVGSWISVMGLFKRMDYIGLKDYVYNFQQIFPHLSNCEQVPEQMQRIAQTRGRGIHNLDGLYPHTSVSAKELDQSFSVFNKEIYSLIETYRAKKKNLNL